MKNSFQIIPAIDILNGQVVRLTQGDYEQVQQYQQDPVAIAKAYEDAGAQKIHIVDLDGAKDAKLVNQKSIEKIRAAVNCKLEFGGGIRSLETADLLVSLGIDYLVLGSLLIKDKETSKSIIEKFPNQLVAGIDARGDKIAVNGWKQNSEISIFSLLNELKGLPVAYTIYTDIATDGMLSGPNIEMLCQVAANSSFPVVASGGIRNKEDITLLENLHNTGKNISGCIIGKAILSGYLELEKLFY